MKDKNLKTMADFYFMFNFYFIKIKILFFKKTDWLYDLDYTNNYNKCFIYKINF